MMEFRPHDFERISYVMLLRLAACDMAKAERRCLAQKARHSWTDAGVPWGSANKAVSDVLKIVNDKRKRDGREPMGHDELALAIRSYLDGKRKDPLVEELTDALSNLREHRLGTNKFPLLEGLKRTA